MSALMIGDRIETLAGQCETQDCIKKGRRRVLMAGYVVPTADPVADCPDMLLCDYCAKNWERMWADALEAA